MTEKNLHFLLESFQFQSICDFYYVVTIIIIIIIFIIIIFYFY